MPTVERYRQGTPCWADIGLPDLAAGRAFYADLFGWEIEEGGPEIGHYSMARLRGLDVAALGVQQVPGVVAWTTYLAVDDLDATVARAEAAGATVLAPPMDVMTFGRTAVIADPGGAVVSFWQAGDHHGASIVNEPGCVIWNELTTRAVAKSLAFYETVVGLRGHAIDMEGTTYWELQLADGTAVAGLMPMEGDMWPAELPNHWMVYFAVEDTDAIAERCIELGGAAPVPPSDIPPGRFAVLNDPQGGVFSVIREASAPA